MKVVVPVLEDRGLDSPISEHFGHAPYFAILDTDSGDVNVVPNPMPEHGPGDLPRWVQSQGADVLVVRGIGARAVEHFRRMGITVVRGVSGTLRDVLEGLRQGTLRDIPYQVREKYHRHGED